MLYTYSERGHSGLQEYVLSEKLNFLKKIEFLTGRSPLRRYSSRNGIFPAEMLKILSEMVHRFLHLPAEMENTYREK